MPREDKLLFDIVHAARLISEFLNGMDRAAFDDVPVVPDIPMGARR